MFRAIFAAVVLILSAPALAQGPSAAVSLDSKVMVERTTTDAQGQAHTTLEEPQVVIPGDKLVFTLSYTNTSDTPATNFVVNNPLPDAVAFDSTADPEASVSVDGGSTWGQLADLTVKNPDGTDRPARASDVTHVRWVFANSIPAHATGRLMFRGIVR